MYQSRFVLLLNIIYSKNTLLGINENDRVKYFKEKIFNIGITPNNQIHLCTKCNLLWIWNGGKIIPKIAMPLDKSKAFER